MIFQNVCPPPWEKFWPSEKNLWEPKQMNDIRWNFEKWLIDTDGKYQQISLGGQNDIKLQYYCPSILDRY